LKQKNSESKHPAIKHKLKKITIELNNIQKISNTTKAIIQDMENAMELDKKRV
jgi:hypothetical protein